MIVNSHTRKRSSLVSGVIVPVVFFGGIMTFAISFMNSSAKVSQTETLKSAERSVLRSVVSCYAYEGVYPPDIAYLRDNYGLLIDESKYIIHYEQMGANIMPTVTVLPLDSGDNTDGKNNKADGEPEFNPQSESTIAQEDGGLANPEDMFT